MPQQRPSLSLEERRKAADAIRKVMLRRDGRSGMTRDELLAIAEKALGKPVPLDSVGAVFTKVRVRRVGDDSYKLYKRPTGAQIEDFLANLANLPQPEGGQVEQRGGLSFDPGEAEITIPEALLLTLRDLLRGRKVVLKLRVAEVYVFLKQGFLIARLRGAWSEPVQPEE